MNLNTSKTNLELFREGLDDLHSVYNLPRTLTRQKFKMGPVLEVFQGKSKENWEMLSWVAELIPGGSGGESTED